MSDTTVQRFCELLCVHASTDAECAEFFHAHKAHLVGHVSKSLSTYTAVMLCIELWASFCDTPDFVWVLREVVRRNVTPRCVLTRGCSAEQLEVLCCEWLKPAIVAAWCKCYPDAASRGRRTVTFNRLITERRAQFIEASTPRGTGSLCTTAP